MPYVGQSITDLFSEIPQALTKEAARKMTDRAVESMLHVAVINTPVESGRLRGAWRKSEASSTARGWKGEISNSTSYAAFVESGTGLYGPEHASYVIKPKRPGGMLRWIGKDGQVVFARFVIHPGSPGNHMLSISLNVTDSLAQDGGIFTGVLEEWRTGIEGQANR